MVDKDKFLNVVEKVNSIKTEMDKLPKGDFNYSDRDIKNQVISVIFALATILFVLKITPSIYPISIIVVLYFISFFVYIDDDLYLSNKLEIKYRKLEHLLAKNLKFIRKNRESLIHYFEEGLIPIDFLHEFQLEDIIVDTSDIALVRKTVDDITFMHNRINQFRDYSFFDKLPLDTDIQLKLKDILFYIINSNKIIDDDIKKKNYFNCLVYSAYSTKIKSLCSMLNIINLINDYEKFSSILDNTFIDSVNEIHSGLSKIELHGNELNGNYFADLKSKTIAESIIGTEIYYK